MRSIYLKIKEEDVLPIAKHLMNEELKQKGYKIEPDIHIPLIPEFDYNGDIDIPEISKNQKFKVTGFRVYPDIEDPMIIMLDFSEDMVIQLWRDEIITQIDKKNIHGELRPPSVILLKAGDYGDEYEFRLDSEIRDNLISEFDRFKFPGHIRGEEIIIE